MSDNQQFFADTATRILADRLEQKHIVAAESRALPGELFATLAENGIFLMLVPEDQGGIGASLAEALAILQPAGSAAAPGPLLETMLGNSLLAQAGLAPVEGTIALSFVDAQDLTGAVTLHDVFWGGVADHVLAIANQQGRARITLSRRQDWTATAGENAAGEPCDRLTAPALPGQSAVLETPGSYGDALRRAALLRAGQQLGAIEWAFTRTIEYTGERSQFGKQISKFQVIQQMLAELAGHVLATSVLLDAAAAGFSETLVAAAISRMGDAADSAIAICHQVHGAIGYSKEYALNYRTRRLMAWRADFGGVEYWRGSLARSFITATREEFWPAVSDAGLQGAA